MPSKPRNGTQPRGNAATKAVRAKFTIANQIHTDGRSGRGGTIFVGRRRTKRRSWAEPNRRAPQDRIQRSIIEVTRPGAARIAPVAANSASISAAVRPTPEGYHNRQTAVRTTHANTNRHATIGRTCG